MSTTTQPSRKALRLAEQAENSQSVGDAYRYLAHLIRTDPKLDALIEFETHRVLDNADEYDRDADDLRGQALIAGFDPSRDL